MKYNLKTSRQVSIETCNECHKEVEELYDHEMCLACVEYNFCECGQRLEDAWGSPGDGFCRRCD